MIGRRELIGLLAASALVGGCRARERQAGEIVIGSSPTGVPFSFVDPWTNRLTGSMIDTAAVVARALSLKPDMRIVPFVALIPSLASRRIDMIAAAMLRTPERERIVAFSDPVFPYPAGLVVRADDRARYPGLAALRGRRVGAQVGTRFVDQLRDAGVEQVSTYDSLADILRDVDFGRIDAGYGDAPILRYQLEVGPKRAARLVREFTAPVLEQLCFVLRKGDPLLGPLNAIIPDLRARVVPEIARRWHLADAA